MDPSNLNCSEDSAYPAAPDSEYGWEKLFSERLYGLCQEPRNGGAGRPVSQHFRPKGSWNDEEKAPAALCRKIAQAFDGDQIEIWGDGKQSRSFLYIDECLEGILRLMRSSWTGPVNIGSEEMVSIDQLVDLIAELAGKRIESATSRANGRSRAELGQSSFSRKTGLGSYDGVERRSFADLSVGPLSGRAEFPPTASG